MYRGKVHKAMMRLFFILLVALFTMGQTSEVPPPEETPHDLELKCSKNRVLHASEFDDLKMDLRDGKIVNFGKKVKYLYVSTTEVPVAEHDGKPEAINKRTKNSQKFLVGREKDGRGKWVARIYAGEPFFHDESVDTWYKTQTAIMRKENYDNQMKLSFWEKLFNKDAYAKTYYYSDGNGDGDVYTSYLGGCDWAALHDAASGNYDRTTDLAQAGFFWEVVAYLFHRSFFPIATHMLPPAATITSASFRVKGLETHGTSLYRLIQSTQADPTALVGDDFDNCGATDDPVSIATADADPAGLVLKSITWTLDSTAGKCGAGFACITKGGYTKFCVREVDYDCEDDNGCGIEANFNIYTSETTYLTNAPELTVNYTGGESTMWSIH